MMKCKSFLLLFFVLLAPLGCASDASALNEQFVSQVDIADADYFIELDSLLVHYSDSAPGDDSLPVIILQHGFGGNLENFSYITDRLQQDFRVIALDRPPFGYSAKALPADYAEINPYSPQGQSRFALLLMDELGIDKAIILGHSAGGGASLHLAANHPERVTALVLVAPAVEGRQIALPLRVLMSIPPMIWIGPAFVRRSFEGRNEFLERSVYEPQKISDEMRAQFSRGSQIKAWDKALWYYTIGARRTDWEPLAQGLTMPVLVITGDSDQIIAPELSAAVHAQIPDSQLVVMPQTGHIPFQERPGEFLAVLNDWFSGLD